MKKNECQCGCGEKVYGRSGFAKYHFEMFNQHDKRSFAVKKWLLLNGFKEENITDELFKQKRKEYYSGKNSPWGRAKLKSNDHYAQAKQKHKDSMNRNNWVGYINPFSKKYQIDKGATEEEAEILVRKRNKFCKEFWIDKGYSDQDSEIIAKHHNPGAYEYYSDKRYTRKEIIDANNPTHTAYWINQGYTKQDALEKIRSFIPSCIEFWDNEEDYEMFHSNRIRKALESGALKNHYSKPAMDFFSLFPKKNPKKCLLRRY